MAERNQLSDIQKMQFWKYLDANLERFNGLDAPEAAKIATRELPFAVSPGNMRGAAAVIPELNLKRRESSAGLEEAVNELREALDEAHQKIDAMQKRLAERCTSFENRLDEVDRQAQSNYDDLSNQLRRAGFPSRAAG